MLPERSMVVAAVAWHAAVAGCCDCCACGYNNALVASASALSGYCWLRCCGFGGFVVLEVRRRVLGRGRWARTPVWGTQGARKEEAGIVFLARTRKL